MGIEKIIQEIKSWEDEIGWLPEDIADLLDKLPCSDCKNKQPCSENCIEREAILLAIKVIKAVAE